MIQANAQQQAALNLFSQLQADNDASEHPGQGNYANRGSMTIHEWEIMVKRHGAAPQCLQLSPASFY